MPIRIRREEAFLTEDLAVVIRTGLQLLQESFVNLTDPRVARTRWHYLLDIVMIAVCGSICGCDSWEDLPRYGRAKREWLGQFLELPNGIPSADTFARVFQRLDPNEFLGCFVKKIGHEKFLSFEFEPVDERVFGGKHSG